MSNEELHTAYIALVYAVKTYGAVGGETTGTTTSAPTETTPTETTKITTVADKTDIIYNKTDVVT